MTTCFQPLRVMGVSACVRLGITVLEPQAHDYVLRTLACNGSKCMCSFGNNSVRNHRRMTTCFQPLLVMGVSACARLETTVLETQAHDYDRNRSLYRDLYPGALGCYYSDKPLAQVNCRETLTNKSVLGASGALIKLSQRHNQ